jgi:hypothetical protein
VANYLKFQERKNMENGTKDEANHKLEAIGAAPSPMEETGADCGLYTCGPVAYQ